MYLYTYIRLLCENSIMNPPQTSREGQGGGKEGFRSSGYSGLNQENFKKPNLSEKSKGASFGQKEASNQKVSFLRPHLK